MKKSQVGGLVKASTAISQEQIEKEIVLLSLKHGGAWIYSVKPFTDKVTYTQYKFPSVVPDRCYDMADNKIGWKGRVIPFTSAARIREQNRGVSCQ